MTVAELLARLNDLPIEALDKPIFVEEGDGGVFGKMMIEPITESCDDPTILAYMIARERPVQLMLDFTKDVN